MYKLNKIGVLRLSDNANIPNNNIKNDDWQEYQKWLSKGNKPEPEFTPSELKAKKDLEIKMKESEIVQAISQLKIAKEAGLSIRYDYEAQLVSLNDELEKLKL